MTRILRLPLNSLLAFLPLPALLFVAFGLYLARFHAVDILQSRLTTHVSATLSSDEGTLIGCGKPDMKIRFLAYDPIMLHIENFLTAQEVSQLKSLGEPRYSSSTIFSNGEVQVDDQYRTSFSATLPDADPIVNCVKQRAAELQGFAPVLDIEPLQTVRYTTNQTFRGHFDWFEGHKNPESGATEYGSQRWNRLTTFFAILEANCTGGETDFPYISSWNWHERPRWCDHVVCADFDGVMVKPRVGSAIFWVNLHKDGEGHMNTMHSGLKVLNGTKIGLNIWTRGKH